MYSPLTKTSGPQNVGAWLTDALGEDFDPAADGLLLDAPEGAGGFELRMPERLRRFLLDLRLLRGLPLAYLVPDVRLLPAESIRFFELDLTWVDRVVEGVLNAASIGTVEFTYGASLMTLIRTALDGDLADIAAADVPGATWTSSRARSSPGC